MTRRWPGLVHLPRIMVVMHDLLMVVVTWMLLRWLAGQAGAPPSMFLAQELAIVVLIQGVVFWRVGLYRGVWRFASVPDLVNLASAAFIGVLLIVPSTPRKRGTHLPADSHSLSALQVDWVLLASVERGQSAVVMHAWQVCLAMAAVICVCSGAEMSPRIRFFTGSQSASPQPGRRHSA